MTNNALLWSEAQLKEMHDKDLSRAGLFYRIFSRTKDPKSATKKIERKKYAKTGKKLQDIIGIRVVLYFYDDVDIIKNFICSTYPVNNTTIDDLHPTTFSAKRLNIVLDFPPEVLDYSKRISWNLNIDYTYELQVRTIFSEGWHEIEHDLRYKGIEGWRGYEDESRKFSSILASLETCDWALKSLFDNMAHSHYEAKDLENMIRFKFRLRFNSDPIDANLMEILECDLLRKHLFSLDRATVVTKLLSLNSAFPLSINNFIYFLNCHFLNDISILELTPSLLVGDFKVGAKEKLNLSKML